MDHKAPSNPLQPESRREPQVEETGELFPKAPNPVRADLILLLVTLIWGSTFTVVKDAMNETTPFLFLSLRFFLAGLVFIAFFYKKIFPLDFLSLRAGAAVGLCLFAGFAFQTHGLVYTSASRSAFLTSLLVLWIPFISIFVEKERPGVSQWAAIAVAIVGMWFLNRPEAGRLNRGDWLTLACAFFLPCRSFS